MWLFALIVLYPYNKVQAFEAVPVSTPNSVASKIAPEKDV